MKNIKRIIAVSLVLCLCLCFTACHKKNETAVKVGSIKFTSGYYACVLFFTDSQARSKVQDQLTDAGESTDDIDYYKQKIDDKSYVDYVKDETMSAIKKIAATKLYCKENKLKLGDDASTMKSYAEYYWENGYSDILTENGVSKETYVDYLTDLSYEDLYFDHIFGADGEKAVSEEDLKKELLENYAIADILDVDFSEMEEAEITEKTEQLNGYLEDLKSGKRTFDEINKEYNGTTDEETNETDDGSEKPLDSNATFMGGKDTNYSNDYYEDVKAMENGEVKIIDKENNAGKVLIVKKDIMEDPYYLTTYDSMLRHAIADEDFDKIVEEYIKTLKLKEYKNSTKVFKVKKIYYPETTASTEATTEE